MSDRVALFVCDDLVGLLMLNGIVPMMKRMGLEPVLFYTGKHKNRNFKNPSPDEVRFFNVELLNQTIIPFLESQSGLGDKALSYRQLAEREEMTIHDITDVNHSDVMNGLIGDEHIIGGISLRFLQVFEREMIGVLQEKGFFWNIHSGLLPDYKGLLIPPRAIINGETEYGITLHDMACGIDEGGIILTGKLPLNPAKPVLDLYLDTVPLAAQMLEYALQSFLSGMPITPEIKISDKPCDYYPNPTPQEWAAFKSRGGRYVEADRIAFKLAGLFAEVGTRIYADLAQEIERKKTYFFEVPAQPPARQAVAPVPAVQF